jgi:hypothetical protein
LIASRFVPAADKKSGAGVSNSVRFLHNKLQTAPLAAAGADRRNLPQTIANCALIS